MCYTQRIILIFVFAVILLFLLSKIIKFYLFAVILIFNSIIKNNAINYVLYIILIFILCYLHTIRDITDKIYLRLFIVNLFTVCVCHQVAGIFGECGNRHTTNC